MSSVFALLLTLVLQLLTTKTHSELPPAQSGDGETVTRCEMCIDACERRARDVDRCVRGCLAHGRGCPGSSG